MTGVETNRIRSRPRFNGYKKRQFSKGLIARMKENAKINKMYEEKRPFHCSGCGTIKDNNPVLQDDLDIMERIDNCDGVDNIMNDKNLRYEIVITEEGEIKYDNNSS